MITIKDLTKKYEDTIILSIRTISFPIKGLSACLGLLAAEKAPF